MADGVLHLGPLEYAHVLDQNKNTQRVEVGPRTLVLNSNESLVGSVEKFLIIPPRHYCRIRNPVIREESDYKKFTLRLGHYEYRFFGEPFPLFPGEILEGAIAQLPMVPPEHALRLRSDGDIEIDGVQRVAGEEWHVRGPCVYRPQAFVTNLGLEAPVIIPPGQALRLRALRPFEEDGVLHVTGQEYLRRTAGAYLRSVHEEVIGLVAPLVLSDTRAIHLRALVAHRDATGVGRHAGEEWLVTIGQAREWIVDVTQELVQTVVLTTLTEMQYCVVVNPATVVDGRVVSALGKRERREGPASFFLQPGEKLEKGVCATFVLELYQALLLKARDAHEDSLEKGKKRRPGDVWLLSGPCQYIPPTTVEVLERRNAVVLKDNEGIYVRDVRTGRVRAVMGPQSYMLAAEETLWAKEMTPSTLEVLKNGGGLGDGDIRKLSYFESSMDDYTNRPPHQVVSYRCPPGCALQVFNYKEKLSRVVLGPNIATLGPWEHFNVLSLSAGKPKVPNALKSIPLMLGPDFITDQIQVETADHARLSVLYAVNYHFEYDPADPASLSMLFTVPDFVGFVARQLASRIRTVVALTAFDDFHRHSAAIVRKAVFGVAADGSVNAQVRFAENNLVVANLDVQAIAPIDGSMQELLMRSVQMAISISTKSIEETARQDAALMEQAARGRLELQTLASRQAAELERLKLCELRALTAAVESTGHSTAEAHARAESALIEAHSGITTAKLKAEAAKVLADSEGAILENARREELQYQRAVAAIEITKAAKEAELEAHRFRSMAKALTKETIRAMALSGQESKVRLLQSLGLSTALITDGRSPVNLFNTARGLIGDGGASSA